MMMMAVLLGAAPASKPTTATTETSASTRAAMPPGLRRGAADPAVAAVRAAVVALSKEHEQFIRGGGTGTAIRETSDYFKVNPSDAVTPEAIVAAVSARGGGDARTSAYVKWQLLSALPDAVTATEELGPALVKQLLTAYRAAPRPIQRPGVSQQDQQKLDVYVQGKKQTDEADLKAYLDTAVSQVARHNSVILKYRDELYRKLPKNPETFAATMDDLMQRLSAVANDEELVKAFISDVREWATLESRPPHLMNALARAVRRLADAKGPQYYTSPYWHSSNVFAWRKTHGGVDSESALKDLAVYLEELAAQPQLEIKEKK